MKLLLIFSLIFSLVIASGCAGQKTKKSSKGADDLIHFDVVERTLDNGLKVMVPPHIEAGTRIVVNTENATYIERAKD